MPPEIGDLVNLKELHIRDNYLFGTIISEIGNLSNLESLTQSLEKKSINVQGLSPTFLPSKYLE